ncbi:MAG TPA: hypothetical protein VF257_01590 [Solirubrobacteraceae bacterium]
MAVVIAGASLLTHPVVASVIVALKMQPGLSGTAVCHHLDVSPAALEPVVKSMMRRGVLISSGHSWQTSSLALAPDQGPHIELLLRVGTRLRDTLDGAACGDHVGGMLGAVIADALEAQRILVRSAGGYRPTRSGRKALLAWGLGPSDLRPRHGLVAPCCVDQEARPHVGGAVGAGLRRCLVERSWVANMGDGAVKLTSCGRAALLLATRPLRSGTEA